MHIELPSHIWSALTNGRADLLRPEAKPVRKSARANKVATRGHELKVGAPKKTCSKADAKKVITTAPTPNPMFLAISSMSNPFPQHINSGVTGCTKTLPRLEMPGPPVRSSATIASGGAIKASPERW
jgi:hypothetical protein